MKKTLIQIAIFVALCGLIEGAARLYERRNPPSAFEMPLGIQPYMMFTSGRGSGPAWTDILKRKQIPSSITFNNYGFIAPFDYSLIPDADYLRRHGKQPGERIVLITGGSVVHGVGATSNQNAISARLQRHLNEQSGGARYRVLNMGMGSWIAYQQFTGLSLFGRPFDPDWIVIMDGHNDGAAPCIHGSGAGNPMQWPKMLYLTYGGAGAGQANQTSKTLARYSAAARWISGLNADERARDSRALIFDRTDTDKRFFIKLAGLTHAEQDRAVAFYLQSEKNILASFPRANILLSTQPLYWDNVTAPSYRAAFAPDGTAFDKVKDELDRYMVAHGTDSCDRHVDNSSGNLLGYFMARSALRMIDFAAAEQKADPSRQIFYRNVEGVLPYEDKLRIQFFIDNAHFSDLGHDRVAEFFAANILAAERGTSFDFAAFAKRSAEIAAASH